MIEFTIPLNLPVRGVAATDSNASPPEWLAFEIESWANRHQKTQPNTHKSSTQHEHSITSQEDSYAQIQHELESVRVQRDLFAKAAKELQQATKVVEKQLEGLVHEFQEATVELAHAIAAKLIFEEVNQDRFPIASLVHEVVSRLDVSSAAVIRLHPDDLSLVQEQPTIGNDENENSLRYVADSTLARGDCKAKAGEISVVYELRRQIDEIRRQLLSTVNGHAET